MLHYVKSKLAWKRNNRRQSRLYCIEKHNIVNIYCWQELFIFLATELLYWLLHVDYYMSFSIFILFWYISKAFRIMELKKSNQKDILGNLLHNI